MALTIAYVDIECNELVYNPSNRSFIELVDDHSETHYCHICEGPYAWQLNPEMLAKYGRMSSAGSWESIMSFIGPDVSMETIEMIVG